MESFTPRTLISGRVKAKHARFWGANDLDTAFAAAANVLGTEHLAIIHARHQGDIWYLAAPAADLASHPNSSTPLAAALPGTRQHLGDAAYTADLPGGLQVVIVKNGVNLHSFVGTPVMVKRFMALEGVNLNHDCTGPESGKSAVMTWQFAAKVLGRREAKLNVALTLSGIAVALIAAAVWLWAANQATQQDQLREQVLQRQKQAWSQALRSLGGQGHTQTYPLALAQLQKAIEHASQAKGVLVQFDYKDGRATWSLDVNGTLVSGGEKIEVEKTHVDKLGLGHIKLDKNSFNIDMSGIAP